MKSNSSASMDRVIDFESDIEGPARELSHRPGDDSKSISNNPTHPPQQSNNNTADAAHRNTEGVRPTVVAGEATDQSLPQQDRGGGRPHVGEGERNEAETESAVWWVLKSAFVVLMYGLSTLPLALPIMYGVMDGSLIPYQQKWMHEGFNATTPPGANTTTPTGLNASTPTGLHTHPLTLRNLTVSERNLYLFGQFGRLIPGFGFFVILATGLVAGTPANIRCRANLMIMGLHAVNTIVTMLPYFVISDPKTYTAVGWVLTVAWVLLCVPSFFAVVHWAVHVAAKQPDSKWWHAPQCFLGVMFECINAIVIKSLTFYTSSAAFPWTSPFVLFLSSLINRRNAETSVYPIDGASRLNTVSLTMCVYFVRLSHSSEINNPGKVLLLEVFYGVVNIVCKVTLYSRHAAWSYYCGTGECSIRNAVRNARAQVITTMANSTESVFDSHFFVQHFVLRYMLFPSEISLWTLVGYLSFGLTYQFLTNAATVYLVSFVEHIPLREFIVPSKSMKEVAWNLLYFTMCSVWASWYMAPLALTLWSPKLTDKPLSP